MTADPEGRVWYLAQCEQCWGPPMPFRTAIERDDCAERHTAATGHVVKATVDGDQRTAALRARCDQRANVPYSKPCAECGGPIEAGDVIGPPYGRVLHAACTPNWVYWRLGDDLEAFVRHVAGLQGVSLTVDLWRPASTEVQRTCRGCRHVEHANGLCAEKTYDVHGRVNGLCRCWSPFDQRTGQVDWHRLHQEGWVEVGVLHEGPGATAVRVRFVTCQCCEHPAHGHHQCQGPVLDDQGNDLGTCMCTGLVVCSSCDQPTVSRALIPNGRPRLTAHQAPDGKMCEGSNRPAVAAR